jgi:hypothetical protein
MAGPMQNRARVDRELVGEPLAVGSYTVQPAAKVGGWYGASEGAGGGGFGGWLHVVPTGVTVRDRYGREQSLPIIDTTAETLRGIVGAGLFVAVTCLVLMLVGKRCVRNCLISA